MKIHISLVGKETVPVYMGIVEVEPDEVILIHSANTKTECDRIKSVLSPNIKVQCKEFDPADLKKIFYSLNKLRRNLLDKIQQEDKISLNLVGGTKFWSLAFYSVFNSMNNVSINLVDQQNNFWDFVAQNSKQLIPPSDIKIIFELNGNPAPKNVPFTNYTEEDFIIAQEVEKVRKINVKDFNDLTIFKKSQQNELDKKENERTLQSRSKLIWIKPDYAQITLYRRKSKTPIVTKLRSPHAVAIVNNSHWFELKIAKLLSNIYPKENIYMNCRFINNGTAQNEVDIIINTGNKLLFVECKTQITNTTDIDKFSTVVENYGGKSSKALFITDAKMSESIIRKCDKFNIAHFSLAEVKNDGQNILESLQKILRTFINDINK